MRNIDEQYKISSFFYIAKLPDLAAEVVTAQFHVPGGLILNLMRRILPGVNYSFYYAYSASLKNEMCEMNERE